MSQASNSQKRSSKPKKESSNVIRYAIVGVGHIAQVSVLPAFKNVKNSKLKALITGDTDKGLQLKRKYKDVNIVSYKDYDSYLASGEVDAVYIALPNDMHYEFCKRALQQGVHVLCEKPFTLKTEEAKELHHLAERKNLKLMVAYRLHFEASNLRVVELAQSGQLGDLKYFTSTFSFNVTDPDNIRLQAERGGGPVWDIGIYCINAARYVFQDEPTEVMAMAERGPDRRFQEVDESLSVIMRFPKNRLASFTCSFGSSDAAEYMVMGSKGYAHLDRAYEYVEPRELEIQTKSMKAPKVQKYKKSDQFGPELQYFSDCILKNKIPEPNALEGMMDTKIILAIEDSVRTGRAVKIRSSHVRVTHPKVRQKSFKAPIEKVEPVEVDSPHS